jgi:hypothetical protein
MMLLIGAFLVVFGSLARSQASPMTYHHRGRSLAWILTGVTFIAGAFAGYLGFGPRPPPDRRVLLKRGMCPVCTKPLDKDGARGETISCGCGAVWERRFL